MKIIANIFVLGPLLLLLSACNTIEGAGKDIEAAGEKIEEVAGNKKNY